MPVNLPQAALAVGALGTAATGLVDTTKVFGGGISRAGLRYIKQLIRRTVPELSGAQSATGLTSADILDTLRANWMNGMETGAQKAIAKSFIKLHLNPKTAGALAKETNVDPDSLKSVAGKLASMASLQPPEADTYGRFDVAISALVDRAYERGDQFYRNSCKALAAVFAIGLAFAGNYGVTYVTKQAGQPDYTSHPLLVWQVVIIGLIATPLAPVAKDIANAIQTASDAVRAVKG